MTRIDAVFATVGKKKYFLKLDFMKGYWQIPLTEESKSKTAFSTTSGLYLFRFMPFGIKTAPAVFSKLMRKVAEGIPNVDHYYDDLLVATETWEEHLRSLGLLFERVQSAGLTVCAPVNANLVWKKSTSWDTELAGAGYNHWGKHSTRSKLHHVLQPSDKYARFDRVLSGIYSELHRSQHSPYRINPERRS